MHFRESGCFAHFCPPFFPVPKTPDSTEYKFGELINYKLVIVGMMSICVDQRGEARHLGM